MINYNQAKCVSYKSKQNNIAFTSNPIVKTSTYKKKNILQKFLSFFGIKTSLNRQLVKQMEEILRDGSFVNRKHSSFRATANDFIFGNDSFMQCGMLNGCPIYKADGYYVIQSFDKHGVTTFNKFSRKGELVDAIQLTSNTL